MNTKTVLACTAVIVAFAFNVHSISIPEDASPREHSHSSNHSSSNKSTFNNEQESHVSSGGN